MATPQTLPNLPSYKLWGTKNQQTENDSMSLEVAQVRLTSAQLLALHTTPIQLTPTPLAGQSLYVYSITAKLTFGTTAYTLNAGDLKVFYGPVANGHPITADLSSLLTQTASKAIVNIPTLVVAVDTAANTTGVPLYVGNDVANYTLGDGVVDITVIFGRTTP